MPLQPPVIVVPGITATTLEDFYPVEPEEVWTAVLKKNFDRIALYPDRPASGAEQPWYEVNANADAIGPARVRPRNAFDIAYGDLAEALRHELAPSRKKPVPVYTFGYDWRQDLSHSARELGEAVDEVLGRTAILPHYRKDPPEAVDLVGHSSGGLVITRYLRHCQDDGSASRVRRVVTMGTAFHGSVHAVQKMTTGMGMLTGPEPRDREREAARTIPHLYQLLPSYEDAVRTKDPLPTDLFDPDTWQRSVPDSLAEYVKLRKAAADPAALFQGFLDGAADLVAKINGLDPAAVLLEGLDGWLPIVGVDAETHVAVEVKLERKKVRFAFPDEVNEWPAGEATGDGTVPFRGAIPDFLGPDGPARRSRLACVAPGDLGTFEIGDRLLVTVGGLHGFLPRVNLVQRLAIKFLRPEFGGKVWARKAPGVAKPVWPKWLKPKV